MVWQCSKHSMRWLLCCTPPPPFFPQAFITKAIKFRGRKLHFEINSFVSVSVFVDLSYESGLLPYGAIKMNYARWQWTKCKMLELLENMNWFGMAWHGCGYGKHGLPKVCRFSFHTFTHTLIPFYLAMFGIKMCDSRLIVHRTTQTNKQATCTYCKLMMLFKL